MESVQNRRYSIRKQQQQRQQQQRQQQLRPSEWVGTEGRQRIQEEEPSWRVSL